MRRWQDNNGAWWRVAAGGAGVAVALAAVLVWVSGQWREAPEAVVQIPAVKQDPAPAVDDSVAEQSAPAPAVGVPAPMPFAGGPSAESAPTPSAGDSAANTPTPPSAAPETVERMKQALQQIKSASMPPSEAAIDGKRERLLVTRRPGMAEMHGGPFSLLAAMQEVDISHLGALDITIVEVPVGWDLDHLRKIIAEDPSVESAERDHLVRVQGRVVPNDPDFGQQINLDHSSDVDVDAPEAWAYTTGSEEVVVAVIDTGIDYSHLDLLPNLWVNSSEIANNNIDDDGNGFIDDVHGVTTVRREKDRREGDPWDDNGHGTRVSSVIGARGGNGALLTGVNWNVRIMSIKALRFNGNGNISDIVRGTDYITSMSKNRNINIKVVNASYSAAPTRATACPTGNAEYRAITRLGEEGILFVAAAGNDGKNIDTSDRPDWPACFDHNHLISVAYHLEHTRRLSSLSNYGAISVDLAAPGRRIPSAGSSDTRAGHPPPSQRFPSSRKSGVEDIEAVYFHSATETDSWTWTMQEITWAPTTRQRLSGLYSWTDSPGGNYKSNRTIVLASPDINLSRPIGNDFPFFSAWINTALEFSGTGKNCKFCDSLHLEFCILDPMLICKTTEAWSDSTRGEEWTRGGWALASFAIPTWIYTHGPFFFRFVLRTDGSDNHDGVYIDDIRITRHATGADTWGRPSGTSFAAPHVAGAAALLWAHRPGLSVGEVRAALLDTVDKFPTDSIDRSRVASGGALNIANALFSVTEPGIRIHSSQTTVMEGANGYLDVSLTREPRGTPNRVVVRAAATTAGRITGISPGALTFTQENWHLPQRINFGTLAGVFHPDPVEPLQLSVDAPQSDPDYAAVSRSAAVQVDVERGIYIHASQTTVAEDTSGYLDVSLTRAPQGAGRSVLLQIVASDPQRIGVQRNGFLLFNNDDWHRPKRLPFDVRGDRILQPTTATEFLQISVRDTSDPAWAAVSRSIAVQLINDDLWAVSTTSLTVSEGSSASVDLVFHPLVFNPLPQDVSMTIAVGYGPGANPGDYAVPAVIRAAAGSTGTRFTIRIIDDEATETTESIILQITPSSPDVLGTQVERVFVTIPANDPAATLEVSPTLLAEGGSAVVTVRLDIPIARDVMFNINADPENPARYSLANPLTITRGTTHGSVVLSAPDNGVQEESQTVTLTFTQTSGSDVPVIRGNPSTVQLRIVDDLLLMRLRVFLEGAVSTDGRSTTAPDPP